MLHYDTKTTFIPVSNSPVASSSKFDLYFTLQMARLKVFIQLWYIPPCCMDFITDEVLLAYSQKPETFVLGTWF